MRNNQPTISASETKDMESGHPQNNETFNGHHNKEGLEPSRRLTCPDSLTRFAKQN